MSKHEIILIRGLGMTGTIYAVEIESDKYETESELAGQKVRLLYSYTGYDKYRGGKKRRVFELIGIKAQEKL